MLGGGSDLKVISMSYRTCNTSTLCRNVAYEYTIELSDDFGLGIWERKCRVSRWKERKYNHTEDSFAILGGGEVVQNCNSFIA